MVLPAFFFSYDSEIYDINSSDNGVHGIVTMKVVFQYISADISTYNVVQHTVTMKVAWRRISWSW